MFEEEEKAVANKLESSQTLEIESIFNEEFNAWEVSLQGKSLGAFATEDEAADCAANVHLAFEMGYVNGLLLGREHPEKAKAALEDRGVSFSKYIKFED